MRMAKLSLTQRHIILGRNSKVWASLKRSSLLVNTSIVAISHKELPNFIFFPGDKVWVFSYSRSKCENHQLLRHLSTQKSISVIYISSASTNVTSITRCYSYPAVKQQAAEHAVKLCNAIIVNIGWFYNDVNELPSGITVATSSDELATLIRDGDVTKVESINLFHFVDRPFQGLFEKILYRLYGELIQGLGRYPCLLRPLDLLLRLFGIRWYGYFYLSNRLWFTTI